MKTRSVYTYQPYQDRRQLVQELRLAAVKASTGRFPPQPPQLLHQSPSPSSSASNLSAASPFPSPLSNASPFPPSDPWPKPKSSRTAPTRLSSPPPLLSSYTTPAPVTLEKPPPLGMNLVSSSAPLETQLNMLEHAAEGGGSGVVLTNNTYREMRVLQGGEEGDGMGVGVGAGMEEYHHHHHHHHHHYHQPLLSKQWKKSKSAAKPRGRRASEVLKQVAREPEHRHEVLPEKIPTGAQTSSEEDDDDDSRFDEEEEKVEGLGEEGEGEEEEEAEEEEPLRRGEVAQDSGLRAAKLLAQLAQVEAVEESAELEETLLPLGQVLAEAKRLDVEENENFAEQVRGKSAVEKAGYLMKSPGRAREGKVGKWRKRFFKLSSRVLAYMADEQSTLPKAMIDLANVVVETEPESVGSAPFPHAFLLKDQNTANPRIYRICAESHREIFGWYKAIVTNAALLAVNSMDAEAESTHNLQDFYPLYRKPPSYYDLLRVAPDASSAAIKKAYRKLAIEFHPDRNPEADPKEFSAISQAYDVLVDTESREDYDLAEKVKDVLRRGFEAILYLPKKMTYDPKSQRHYPAQLASKQALIFCDGELKHLYYQDLDEETPQGRFQVRSKQSFELRFVQRITYGRNDIVMASAFGSPSLEQDKRIVLHGSKLEHDVYLELDTHQACKELLEGLRIIRCGKSAVFAQQLAKWQEKGYD